MTGQPDPYAMTWSRHVVLIGEHTWAEYRGSSEYHSAVVTDGPTGDRWQARITTVSGDQYSPYYRAPAAAKAWAARYGRPRPDRKRARR